MICLIADQKAETNTFWNPRTFTMYTSRLARGAYYATRWAEYFPNVGAESEGFGSTLHLLRNARSVALIPKAFFRSVDFAENIESLTFKKVFSKLTMILKNAAQICCFVCRNNFFSLKPYHPAASMAFFSLRLVRNSAYVLERSQEAFFKSDSQSYYRTIEVVSEIFFGIFSICSLLKIVPLPISLALSTVWFLKSF